MEAGIYQPIDLPASVRLWLNETTDAFIYNFNNTGRENRARGVELERLADVGAHTSA